MNNIINNIANIVLALLVLPIGYLIFINIYKRKMLGGLKSKQKERDKNSCKIHNYIRLGPMRVCEDCGYSPSMKVYFNTDKIKIQIDLNKELSEIDGELDKKVEEILKKHNISSEQLSKVSYDCSLEEVISREAKSNLIKKYTEMIKEQGLDREI